MNWSLIEFPPDKRAVVGLKGFFQYHLEILVIKSWKDLHRCGRRRQPGQLSVQGSHSCALISVIICPFD